MFERRKSFVLETAVVGISDVQSGEGMGKIFSIFETVPIYGREDSCSGYGVLVYALIVCDCCLVVGDRPTAPSYGVLSGGYDLGVLSRGYNLRGLSRVVTT